MQREDIKNKLMEVIEEDLPDLDTKAVDVSADFVDEYDVNSIQLIQLIVDSENEFDVSFDDKELDLAKYKSFDDLIDTIDNKVNK